MRRPRRSSVHLFARAWTTPGARSSCIALAAGLLVLAVAGLLPAGDGDGAIIAEGHLWRFLRGTQAPPESWAQPGFDDSAWEEGPTGIGYGDEDDRTVLEDMRCQLPDGEPVEGEACLGGGYLAFFARTTFETPSLAEGERLVVKVSYDDGFVLYVNGVQVKRVNMPDGPVTHETAALKAVGDAPAEPDAVIPIPLELLRDVQNTLAASVHNVSLRSSDASFIPRVLVTSGEEPPPKPGCEDLCAARAAEAVAACLKEGLPEAECVARKAAVREECIQAECGKEPPPEPGCEDLCAARATEALQRCLSEGLPEAECVARKAAVREECIQAECVKEPPPPEPGCQDRCAEVAAKVARRCREEGGTEEACHERSAAALRECVASCEGEPHEMPCADECSRSGKAVFLACVEAGGLEAECRHRADAIVSLCLERCGVGTPCEDRCAVAAQIVLTGCNLAELPEGDCRELANSVLERCVASCEPAASCEDGCGELAARAVEECRGREGPDAECEAAGAAVLAECLAHCEGEPVPSCEEQCRDKAAEMLHRCVAEGGSEAECVLERDAFLAHCNEQLGEVCTAELAALQSAFRSFERGDANRDGLVDLSDAVAVLGNLFLGTASLPCQDAADADDDGTINITDPILILGSLFLGGGPLAPPSGEPGQDPTGDGLLCES